MAIQHKKQYKTTWPYNTFEQNILYKIISSAEISFYKIIFQNEISSWTKLSFSWPNHLSTKLYFEPKYLLQNYIFLADHFPKFYFEQNSFSFSWLIIFPSSISNKIASWMRLSFSWLIIVQILFRTK